MDSLVYTFNDAQVILALARTYYLPTDQPYKLTVNIEGDKILDIKLVPVPADENTIWFGRKPEKEAHQ